MAGINTLLATLPPSGVMVGGPEPPVAGASGDSGSGLSSTGLGGDTFEQGQWWKNSSRAAGAESSGDWRAKAALQAYGVQQAKGVGMGGAAHPEAVADPVGGRSEGMVVNAGEDAVGEQPSGSKGSVVGDQETASNEGVRAHEQAHLASAGGYAVSGASFQYQRGPDGRRYAVGGEVQIDTSDESDPEKTIQKMNVVRAAALAPANPSSQDRSIAAKATAGIVEAQRELQSILVEEAAVRRDDMAQQGGAEGARQDAASRKGDVVGTTDGQSQRGIDIAV